MVDHEDRNQLNDRIENLRPASSSQNNRNKTSAKGSSSIYLGVSWNKFRNVWAAQIRSNKINKTIGGFQTQEEAALAYNKYAVKIHGEYANLNIIKL